MTSHIHDPHSVRYTRGAHLVVALALISIGLVAGQGNLSFSWWGLYTFFIALFITAYGWGWFAYLNKQATHVVGEGIITHVEVKVKFLHKLEISSPTLGAPFSVWSWKVAAPTSGGTVKLAGNTKHWVLIPYNERDTYWPAWKTPTPKTAK